MKRRPALFHPEALAELQEQALFYQQRDPGLGDRFAARIDAAIALAVAMPEVGSPYLHGTRRVFPSGFPHSVVYRHTQDHLVILAIAPFRRRPGYWRRRR